MSNVVSKAAGLAAEGVDALKRRVGTALGRDASGPEGGDGWIAVTINRPSDEVAASGWSARLGLGDRVETRLSPAPGDKGTEVAGRLVVSAARPETASAEGTTGDGPVHGRDGEDSRAELRSALRRVKQELEVGEVLRVDPVPHGERKPTRTGKLIEEAAKRAGGGGIV